MSTWRRKAIEAAPELQGVLEAIWSPMAAWIELRIAFEQAIGRNDMQGARRASPDDAPGRPARPRPEGI
ncbi:Uncharacterised protein [Bordetella ansorpii]|uniref:Uncharacterized protein n=1 Tax=Bordetella ansorpii TaxID=288768 RepID=A0A157R2V3_9BORD|nr:hypothetical protein [Bordetella ansorpii]SAI52206.1 Uncharacterised protein [Bordetella ansorpii]